MFYIILAFKRAHTLAPENRPSGNLELAFATGTHLPDDPSR